MHTAQYLQGVLQADALHQFLLRAVQLVQVPVDPVDPVVGPFELGQVPHGLKLAARIHQARDHQMPEEPVGHTPGSDLVEELSKHQFRSQQPHGLDPLEDRIEPVRSSCAKAQLDLAHLFSHVCLRIVPQLLDAQRIARRADRPYQHVPASMLAQNLHTIAARRVPSYPDEHSPKVRQSPRPKTTIPDHQGLHSDEPSKSGATA